ncbi:MAG: nucleotidyltransferase domain-containing protein, partial [Deltaproteobacteria bacterium]|nr:nucleotidyltransferase domain-containing protein [Deltaproteobacteria bacterium]
DMDKTEVIKKLKKYKKLLSKNMLFDQMVLFGSYATGNNREDSDIDVAVIVDKIEGDYFSTRPLLWKLRREIDDRIEPVILDKNHDESGFLKEILKNGIQI